jgi:DNA polymerase IV (DinB-like DNA polymerase)
MEETLPGVADDDPGERIVCHVDMDCFYASCERLKEPELAGEAVVVGMGYESGENHGAVATASYEAREYGVDSAQPISDALERLPRMVDADADDPDAPDPADAGYYRPVDMEFYESVASEVKEILHDAAETVREVSIDEAYLDVTEQTRWETVGAGGSGDDDGDGRGHERTLAEGYARYVKQEIQRQVGVPASVGVAPNMSIAKIASDYDKPDGLTVVRPEEVESFLAPLPVEDIHGVGPVRAREFAAMGIETAGDLAAADPAELVDRFGDRGRELYDRARGHDDREVTPRGRPKSLSRESAFTEATADSEAKREKVRALAADVAERARSREAMYRTIGIKVVEPPFDVNTRAESLSGPVDEPELVRKVALELLEEFAESEVRKLGVRVSKLSFGGGEQSTLGGYEGVEGSPESPESGDPPGSSESPKPRRKSASKSVGRSESTATEMTPSLADWDDQRTPDDGTGRRPETAENTERRTNTKTTAPPETLDEWAGVQREECSDSTTEDDDSGREETRRSRSRKTQPSLGEFEEGREE